MRRGIVEGDDFSLLPPVVVRLLGRLTRRGRKPGSGATAPAAALFHLALADDWGRDPDEPYTTSTLGVSLEEQGFLHCSYREQVQRIADLVYRDRDDVVLLQIDPSRVECPIKVEPGGDGDSYPHIYGPLPRAAVVRVTPLARRPDGRLDVGAALS